MTYKIDVNIVDDHTMLVEGLTEAINRSDSAHVSHSYATLEECRRKMGQQTPDVLLLDITMPDGSGIDFCQQMLTDYPSVKVVAITCHDEFSVIQRMLEIGVHGYVLKSAPVQEVLEAITTVFHGGKFTSSEVDAILEKGTAQQVFLTNVEQEVLRLICEGMTNPQIAEEIHLSADTINWYRKRLLSKFKVKNSVSLAILATKEKLI